MTRKRAKKLAKRKKKAFCGKATRGKFWAKRMRGGSAGSADRKGTKAQRYSCSVAGKRGQWRKMRPTTRPEKMVR